MLYCVCKRLVPLQFPNKNGLSMSNRASTQTMLRFLQTPIHNTSSVTIRTRPISSSSSSSTNINSFTVTYLINSCGLSEQKALSISKKFRFDTPSKPDAVLTLLRNYGFTNTHISNFVSKHPSLLLADVHESLQPKLDFFCSIGLSGHELGKVLSGDPGVLTCSLEKQIIPTIDFLRSVVHTDANVVTVFKRSTWTVRQNPEKSIVPNIVLLRAHGVSDFHILSSLKSNPRVFLRNTDRFVEFVERAKEMGFDPKKLAFVNGVRALMSAKSIWEAKVEVYKRWGLTEEEIRRSFLVQPFFMLQSEEKITSIMEFLVNKVGYSPSQVARQPAVIMLSLEKRIIPRCLVWRVLSSKGLVKKDMNLSTILLTSNKIFLESYVIKFENQIPELLDIFQGKVNSIEHLLGIKETAGMKVL